MNTYTRKDIEFLAELWDDPENPGKGPKRAIILEYVRSEETPDAALRKIITAIFTYKQAVLDACRLCFELEMEDMLLYLNSKPNIPGRWGLTVDNDITYGKLAEWRLFLGK